MCGHTEWNKIKSEITCNKVEVVLTEHKMYEVQLTCFQYVRRRPIDELVGQMDEMEQVCSRRGRPR